MTDTSPSPKSATTLTASPSPRRRRTLNAEAWTRYGYVVLSHLLLLAAWQALVVFSKLPAFVLPSPLATVRAITDPNYRWIENIVATATEIFGGYALGVVASIALAMVFCWFRQLEMILSPLLVSLNMIPKVALGPLIIVWFKYGIGPNILIAFTICFFPMVLTTSRGLREVEPDLLDLVRSLKGSRWQIFTKIQLPSALPYVFSGMKVGAILAVAGAVVGEFLGSDRGLGYLMLQVQVNLDTPAMFMALLLITAIGLALYGLVLWLEHLVVPRDARLD
jgi:NitT/TauT family transport system permease protein